MDLNKMSYDELEELKINLLDELDYYRNGSKKHNDIYFKLEEVYKALRKYKWNKIFKGGKINGN